MRRFAVFLFLFVFKYCSAQLPLNFQSYAIRLSVSKDQRFVLTTKAGEVGTAAGLYETWQRSDPKGQDLFGPTLEGSCFFNKDTGFIYGFIGNEKATRYNYIYLSTNGGQEWVTTDFGQSGWVDDACAGDNGEAWLSVSGSGIAYTKDYGFHWEKIDIPEKKQRFGSIFFNANHHGVIASLWNVIAYTTDNGGHWKYLPTPLDQNKYNKTNRNSRPEFSRVAIFNNYILVKQEDFVFYTPTDSINWTALPAYTDFFTDGDNTSLFFKTTQNKFVRSDENFHSLYSLETEIDAYDARCRNGDLFVATASGIVQVKPDNSIVKVPFQTKGSESIDPYGFGYSTRGFYGVKDNKVFLQKDYKGVWAYQFTLPFDVSGKSLSVWDNTILYQKGDSVYYFSFSGKLLRAASQQKMVEEFCEAGISQIVFNRGSRGCFHYFEDVLTYSRKGAGFGYAVERNTGNKHEEQLAENDDEISGPAVHDFLQKVPAFFQAIQMSSIKDLGFTEEDYEQCKKDIRQFRQFIEKGKPAKRGRGEEKTSFHFERNNLDFDRLLNLVDSVKFIDTARLNSILFHLSEMWSTTTDFTGFTLINNRNE